MTNAVNIAQSGSNNQTMRNRIINGAMTIDQRNNGASVTPTTTAYTLDRWALVTSTSSRLSIQRSTVAPAGFTNSTIATVVSSYTPGSSDSLQYQQAIEGFNMADFGWGTASAQPVTLSFWVRSSQTGTFSVMFLSNGTGGTYRNYIGTYTINSANTFEQKSITIPGDTTGTWDTGNSVGIYLAFDLGCGSGTATAAGSWANGVARKATGANTFVSQSNGSTWYITGVQLEEGTAASPFENRLYGTELNLCLRYTFVWSSFGNSFIWLGSSGFTTGSGAAVNYVFPVQMRVTPTTSFSEQNKWIADYYNGNATSTAISASFGSPNSVRINITASTPTNFPTFIANNGDAGTRTITFSAEL
jgi:hypothetical protein